jgi:hypothetical protein
MCLARLATPAAVSSCSSRGPSAATCAASRRGRTRRSFAPRPVSTGAAPGPARSRRPLRWGNCGAARHLRGRRRKADQPLRRPAADRRARRVAPGSRRRPEMAASRAAVPTHRCAGPLNQGDEPILVADARRAAAPCGPGQREVARVPQHYLARQRANRAPLPEHGRSPGYSIRSAAGVGGHADKLDCPASHQARIPCRHFEEPARRGTSSGRLGLFCSGQAPTATRNDRRIHCKIHMLTRPPR